MTITKTQVKEKVQNFINLLNDEIENNFYIVNYLTKAIMEKLHLFKKVNEYHIEYLDNCYNKGVVIEFDGNKILMSYDTIISIIDTDNNITFFNIDMISKTTKKHIDLFTSKYLNKTFTKTELMGKEKYTKYYDSDYYHYYM